MNYTLRELTTSVLILVFAFIGLYRLKKGKLNLIKVNSDHLILWRQFLGEFVFYADDISELKIMLNKDVLIKTKSKIYKIDDTPELREIIKFCHNNDIKIHKSE